MRGIRACIQNDTAADHFLPPKQRFVHRSFMENPHEQVQNAVLSRIINNAEQLNESVLILNKALQEVNRENMDVELLAQMWENYQRNAQFHLEATGNANPPL